MKILLKNRSHQYSFEDFNKKIKEKMQNVLSISYSLISLDLDNFNFINDLFGFEVGDIALGKLEKHFSQALMDGEFFSRIHADHFVFWVKSDYEESTIQRFYKIVNVKTILSDVLSDHYNIVCSGGVVNVSKPEKNLSSLFDKANFARKQAKGNHLNTFLLYDKKMNEEVEWKKIITLTMESALNNHEFEMYLQPKVLIKNNKIVGAEALVRWNSKKYGIIYPDKFIPILEQNGFIKQLDFYMLEQACLFIRKTIDSGNSPLPISVNFSKIHIKASNFVEKVFQVVHFHNISTKLIEIELTENVFSDDFQTLIDTVSALKYLGFTVSLDDFGRAYSSLNYLKDLPLDVIKIDKGFLHSSENTSNGRIIISKIVEMIKSLRMISLMEGVETLDHVSFLQNLNCDLGQGYFYAKPMPVENYNLFLKQNTPIESSEYLENLHKCEDITYSASPEKFQMDNWELYTLGEHIGVGLMKGYLDGSFAVQYLNDKALEYIGYTREEFRKELSNSIMAFIHPDDIHIMQQNAANLASTGSSLKFKTIASHKDGTSIILQVIFSSTMNNSGRFIGICALQEVAEKLEYS